MKRQQHREKEKQHEKDTENSTQIEIEKLGYRDMIDSNPEREKDK